MYRFVLLFLIISTNSLAIEFKPYAKANISVEKWVKYFNSVKSTFPDSERIYPDENLIVFSNIDGDLHYAFTLKDHLAHPAWITRKVYEENDTVKIAQIGYFAGAEKPFAELFRQYQELNEVITKEMSKTSK